MNPKETLEVLRRVKALGNGQQFTADTGPTWADALAGVSLQDAFLAVEQIARRSRYIDLLAILQEVAEIRSDRLRVADQNLLTPVVDPDDEAGYRAEVRALQEQVASGRWGDGHLREYQRAGEPLTMGARPRARGVLRPRPVAALTEWVAGRTQLTS